LNGLKKRKYDAVLYMFQIIRQKICDIDEKLSVDISEYLISEFLKQYYGIEKEKYQYINFITSINLNDIVNPIGLVQEIFQKISKFDATIKCLPVYSIVEQSGSPDTRFSCIIKTGNICSDNNGNITLEGRGSSKKNAKKQAAIEMIKYIKSMTNIF
jgi:dsRNA-specific ribonuclease